MIRDNQRLLNRLHILVDALILVFSFLAAYHLRFRLLIQMPVFALAENERYYSIGYYARNLYYLVPVYLVIYFMCGLYRPEKGSGGRRQY